MCTPPTGIVNTKFTVTKLLEKHEYQFRVCAINKVGIGEHADVPGKILLEEKLEAPDLELDADMRKMINIRVGYDLKIEVPIAGHPKPIVTWTKDGVALKQTTRVNVTDSAHNTTLTIKDSTRDDAGMYSINVTNALGSKDATIEVITLDKPGPPTGPVKLEDISAESITLSWEPPTYTGGCQISNYVVEKRDTTTTNWMVVSATVARTTLKISNLKTGAEYQFRIYAENRYGKSYAIVSEPVVAQYPFQEPGPPGTPFVSSYTKDYMDEVVPPKSETDPMYNQTLVINAGETFSLEASVEGKPIPTAQWFKGNVEVENSMKDRNSILWQRVNKTVIRATHFKVTNINAGLIYEFKVAAENAAGISAFSKASDPVLAIDACGEFQVNKIPRKNLGIEIFL
uniref:Titin n=1 Tax=Amphilophus citrinellus TaxID=61819 RepID=A0A3Q0QVF0_AMPCI